MSDGHIVPRPILRFGVEEGETVGYGHGKGENVVRMKYRSLEVVVEVAVAMVLEDDEMSGGGAGGCRRGNVVAGVETVNVVVPHVRKLRERGEGEGEREREGGREERQREREYVKGKERRMEGR